MARKTKTRRTTSGRRQGEKRNSYWYAKRKREREAREAAAGGAAPKRRGPSKRGRYIRSGERETLQQHIFAIRTLKSYISETEAKQAARAQTLIAQAMMDSVKTGKTLITVDASRDDRYRELAKCVRLAREILAIEEGVVEQEASAAAKAAAAKPKAEPGAPAARVPMITDEEMQAVAAMRAEKMLGKAVAEGPAAVAAAIDQVAKTKGKRKVKA